MATSPRKLSRINERERVKSDAVTASLKELVVSQMALSQLGSQPLRAKAAFRVSKILRAVNPELESFETQRRALLDKYGKLPEGATEYEFNSPEARTEFEKEYEELLTAEVSLNVAPLKIEEIDAISIAPSDLAVLSWLFTE
jgi:hypothetical protein